MPERMKCTALGIYVDWWREPRAWHVWTRWLNWLSRSQQKGPLWVHGTLNVENEMLDDPRTALAEAIDIAKAQADGVGAVWSDPAIIVRAHDLSDELQQEVTRQAAPAGLACP